MLPLFHYVRLGFISRGFTDRREILHGDSAWSRTGLLLFWENIPRMAEFWASTGRHMAGYASCWSTCLIFIHCLLTDELCANLFLFIMAVLYVVEEKPLCFASVLYSSTFLFQKVIFEVTGRLPFILSHNIRSWCSLISHPQKLVNLHPHRKIALKPPKMGISETQSDIRWRITLQWNFTLTIAALLHYEGPFSVNPQKRVNFDPKMRD